MNRKKQISNIMMVTAGSIILALAVQLFVVPSGLITGGATGLALAFYHLTGFPVSATVLIINIAMLVWSWFEFGRAFFFSTILSSLVYPAALAVCERLLANVVLTDDLLLCTIFGALGYGISLGLVMRAGASTGGMDIPALVLAKRTVMSVGLAMYLVDFIILILQIPYTPIDAVLYGILMILVYTVVLDKVIIAGTAKTEVKIVSKKYNEILKAIMEDLNRGVTILNGTGGYSGDDRHLVLSIVSPRELPRLEQKVRAIDPGCFMIVSSVSTVRGEGFSDWNS